MIDEAEVPEENEVIQQDELSADLAAAWEEAEEESDDGNEQRGETTLDSETTASPEVIEAEAGDKAPAAAEVPADVRAEVADPDGPPSSLPPEVRELWGETPEAMRKSIVRREKEFEAGILKYSAAAKVANDMSQSLQPHSQYLSMNGGAKQAIGSLLQTGSMLQMGSPQQKTQIVAGIISQFGVDIGMLDDLLVGRAPTQESQQAQVVQQAVNQAVAPYQQTMGQIQQQQQYAHQQNINSIDAELVEFRRTHEFYDDVAPQVATILDSAATAKQAMPLEEAYNIAVNMRPDISAVQNARTNTSSIADKRRAAVSISGNQGGPGDPGQGPDDILSQLNAAWDQVGNN